MSKWLAWKAAPAVDPNLPPPPHAHTTPHIYTHTRGYSLDEWFVGRYMHGLRQAQILLTNTLFSRDSVSKHLV